MSGLIIHGAHGIDVWLETDGELSSLSANDLAKMRKEVIDYGTTSWFGVAFDESDVTALIHALTGPQLDDCHHCEGPALINIEGRTVCPGHAAGYGQAEDESVAS